MTHADQTISFDQLWPRDSEAFLKLLQSSDVEGAEHNYATTAAAIVLTRAFAKVVDPTEEGGALRCLLEAASRTPAEPLWGRALVLALLFETASLPGLSDTSSALIDWVADMHIGGADAIEWRKKRVEMFEVIEKTPKSIDRTALEIAVSLAWPNAVASRTVCFVVPLVCEAAVDAAAIQSDFVFTENDTIMAEYQPIIDAHTADVAAGKIVLPLMDTLAARAPSMFKRLKEERDFYENSLRSAGTRLLRTVTTHKVSRVNLRPQSKIVAKT